MDEQLFQRIERRSAEIQRDPNDGLPVFEDLAVEVSAALSEAERLVLGQIETLNGDWSLATLRQTHKELVDGFAAESGQPYTQEMGDGYMEGMDQAIASLYEKGLAEPVPGQDQPDLLSADTKWQRVK